QPAEEVESRVALQGAELGLGSDLASEWMEAVGAVVEPDAHLRRGLVNGLDGAVEPADQRPQEPGEAFSAPQMRWPDAPAGAEVGADVRLVPGCQLPHHAAVASSEGCRVADESLGEVGVEVDAA